MTSKSVIDGAAILKPEGIKIRVGGGVRWREIVLILILAFLPLLFFWRLLTPDPADQRRIVAGDFTEQYFPLRAFAAQEWVRGRIPLWNPYIYGGQPALADIQSGALYPPHVLEALLLGWGASLFGWEGGFPLQALEWQVIFHFSLAAAGAYLFARALFWQEKGSLRRAQFGAVIVSLVFTYSGYLTGFPVQQVTILETSVWLPWILWGLHSALQQARRPASFISALKPAVGAALAFALASLAGHPQTVLYIFYLTLAYTVFLAFYLRRSSSGNNRTSPASPALFVTIFASLLGRSLILWCSIISLGILIAAIQLLPTLEFINHSLRADLSYQAVSQGLPLNEMIAILYPGFFGGSPQYVGIATLVLIALALVLGWARYRRIDETAIRPGSSAAPLFFWLGTGLAGLLLAFGGNLFLYPIFYLLTPGFDAVRQQERAFLIFSFSAAMLAGYGAVDWAGPLSKSVLRSYIQFERRLRLVGGEAVAMAALFIYGATAATARGDEVNLFFGVLRHHLFGLIILGGMLVFISLRGRRWLRRPWGMGLVALWLAFNLFTVNWQFNLEERPGPGIFTPNAVVGFLQAKLPVFLTHADEASHLSNGDTDERLGRIVSGGLLPGGNNAASVYNLEDLTGNTPLQLAQVETFLRQIPAWRLWQLMNVHYIVDRRDIADPGLHLVFEEDEFKVFKMGDPFPRAWFVSEIKLSPEMEQAIRLLSANEFDIRRSAVVAQPLDVRLGDASASTAEVVNFSPTRLSIAVDAAGQHLLVLSQIYYPGWRAEVDGQPTPLLRVNLVQQGVLVPPGKHLIQVTFWPTSFVTGAVVSAVSIGISVVILIWTGWKHQS